MLPLKIRKKRNRQVTNMLKHECDIIVVRKPLDKLEIKFIDKKDKKQ
jgi:hypothetical protein